MSREVRFHTLDVFTDRFLGGNPLAVFPDATGIPEALFQPLAREFNLSETVFVLPPEDPGHTRSLRIFTPERELPFAGHPTVGTAFLLADLGEVPLTGDETSIVFEEEVGLVPVRITARDGRPRRARLTAARVPETRDEAPSREAVAAVLGLRPEDLRDGDWSPRGYSVGFPFLFVPVRDRAALARITVDTAKHREHLADTWAPELYVFCRDPELPGSDVRARMFSPGLGIPEDPATGSACASLAGYLAARDERRDGTLRWVVEQGFEMGRPSILEVEAEKRDGDLVAVHVGGASVRVSSGTITIPEV